MDSIGPYRLAEVLGEGGMGVVRKGTDPVGRTVAVKLLRGGAGDPIALRRLAREVDTMRRVRSPFVAQIVDADVTADPPYIVTEYVQGRTLEQRVAERGVLDPPALKILAEGLAEALAAIHAAGIVHRDLKPGNVMFRENGQPILIDFGIAQPVDATRLTSAGMVIGTPGYLSPEILNGDEFRAPADVHAWAGTLIFAATGRPPFGTGTFEQVFYKIIQGTADLDGVPAPLLPVLRGAMTANPAERPTAKELAHLCSRLDVSVTMIDHTFFDQPRHQFHSPPPPGDEPDPTLFRPPRPVQEIPVQRAGGWGQPSQEAPSQRPPAWQPQPAERLPQPRDFVGHLPPVAPPPAPPPPGPDPYGDLYGDGRPHPATGGNGLAAAPPPPYADPYGTVNDGPYQQSYAPQPQRTGRQPGEHHGGQPGAQQGGQPGGQQGGWPQGDERATRTPRTRTDEPREADARKPYGLYKLISLGLLAAILGLTWAIPVKALVFVLGLAVVLRASDRAAKGMESRRVRRGERPTDVLTTLMRAPLHLPGALITSALVTLLGLFCSAVLLAFLVVGGQDTTHALTLSIGLMVVLQFWGPGGTSTRRQTARLLAGTLPRREAATVGALCVCAAAAVMVLFSLNQTPDLSPFGGFAGRLTDWRETVQGWLGG
ncbi:serine/threonine-protein kinase [Actinocorallia longicatena]|uniref:Protein kinase domain-containing protein n=1 Tax=Actinocorallia longicatena TaxID=111803 RepID=A0ABP6PZF2_9ACTN